jgi:hypothetical protein
MVTLPVIAGSGDARSIVCTPAGWMLNRIWSRTGAGVSFALAARIAARSEPGPESAAVSTTNTAKSTRPSTASTVQRVTGRA